MRIYGKADEVFKTIKNICKGSPNMTLKEALNRGLLPTNLQNTKLFKIGEYPYVYLDEGFENNWLLGNNYYF